MKTRFSPPDGSNKPTVAETLEEAAIESRAEANWPGTRKTAVAWGIHQPLVRRDIRLFREAARRRKRGA